jgi:hypothetical protein
MLFVCSFWLFNVLLCLARSESSMRLASNIAKENLVALGTCIGKFTNSGKFHLTIHCLDYLSQYAKYKVWVKPSSEMSFLYGNNIPKSGLGRMTDDTPQYAGVVVYNMSDVPLGRWPSSCNLILALSDHPCAPRLWRGCAVNRTREGARPDCKRGAAPVRRRRVPSLRRRDVQLSGLANVHRLSLVRQPL